MVRPRINSTTEEEVAKIEKDKKIDQSRRGKTTGVGRPRINSHLEKTEEKELNKTNRSNDYNSIMLKVRTI